MANAYTPHPCDITGQLRCDGRECGDNEKGERYQGVCDKDGCDINPYRMGNRKFFGRGPEYDVNTLKPVTVVTQFLTTDGTDSGELSEMRRFYVQDGKVVHSPRSTILGSNDTDSITDGFCRAKKTLFDDVNDYAKKGGSAAMGESLDRGHVMAISLWDDVEVNMLWLDSAYPLDKAETSPGVRRGDCPGGEESTPAYVRRNFPDGWVSFQNAFVGPIGSYLMQPPPTPAPCVASCSAASGRHQPECEGRSESRCKQMMSSENKCRWNSCPDPVPTPAPTLAPMAQPTPAPATPRPSPTPSLSCSMKDASVPEGKRCRGKPVGGWGKLGVGVTAEACKQSCIALQTCKFAVFKQGKCSYFKKCDKYKKQQGFSIWKKVCDQGPVPNRACQSLCAKTDLTAGAVTCSYLSSFPKLCNLTYIREGSAITPCQPTSSSCTSEEVDALDCPRFEEQCTGALSLVKRASHRDPAPRHQKSIDTVGLAKWRFNKWQALVQTSQIVSRWEL